MSSGDPLAQVPFTGQETPAGRATRPTVKLWALVSLIIGSTIGSGIFALPQNVASVAAPGPMAIGWTIAAVGMLAVAFVFQVLARRKPHLDSGVYSYVRAGLGDFVGFCSGWGYWLGTVIAQVGYAVLFFSTVGHYVPILSGHGVIPMLAVSAMSWTIFFMITRGVREAALMNLITTLAKIIPIIAFVIIVALIGFSLSTFSLDTWGRNATFTATGDGTASILDQVKGMMLFTVWVFIGIEGASVYSKQAEKRTDVGRATIIGFLSVLALLLAVSFLSFGVMPREELDALGDQAMAGVLEAVVGPWGAAFINIGLCISVLGAYLSWQMLCAEPIALMAEDGLLPKKLGAVNSKGSPYVALGLSTVLIQILIIIFFLNETTYAFMVQLATMLYLLPYFFSSLYLVLLAARGRGLTHPQAGKAFDLSGPEISRTDNLRHLGLGVIAVVYSVWLIYAADVTFILFGALLVVPGLIPYVLTRIQHRERLFNWFEMLIVVVILAAAVGAVWGLANGTLTL